MNKLLNLFFSHENKEPYNLFRIWKFLKTKNMMKRWMIAFGNKDNIPLYVWFNFS